MKKLIPFIVIVLLLGAFYYLFSSRSQKSGQTLPQPTPTVEAVSDSSSVSKVAANYYQSYDTCMKNPPSAAKGMVSEYCQNNSGLTTANFAANLEKGGTAKAGADPIFCAQDIPQSITVNQNVQVADGKAQAFVDEVFGPTQIKIQVNLLKESGVWKVDNIVCPLP